MLDVETDVDLLRGYVTDYFLERHFKTTVRIAVYSCQDAHSPKICKIQDANTETKVTLIIFSSNVIASPSSLNFVSCLVKCDTLWTEASRSVYNSLDTQVFKIVVCERIALVRF